MIPTVIHRYRWPIAEAARALLADDVQDCESCDIRIEHGNLVLDVVSPALAGETIEIPAAGIDHDKLAHLIETGQLQRGGTLEPTLEAPPETPKAEEPPAPPPAPARKGGALATKAGILCNEKAFHVWLDVATPDAAKAKIYERCEVGSRVDLDHEPEAASKFKDMVTEYEVWCELG